MYQRTAHAQLCIHDYIHEYIQVQINVYHEYEYEPHNIIMSMNIFKFAIIKPIHDE